MFRIKKRISITGLLILTGIMAMTFSELGETAGYQPTLVCVKPESIVDIYMVGEDFTVGVYIEQVVDLYSWEIGMEWDPTVLECLKFKEGPFLKTGGGTITISGNINNTEGRIYPPYGCTLTYPAEVGVNGSGTLAYVDFTVKNYGQTNINLTVTLYDSTYQVISADVQPGWFKLTPAPANGPKANFTYSPPLVNKTVTFDASASEPGFNGTYNIPIANYTWDFGDGTNGTGMVVTHAYTTVGTYTVNLTVTCEDDPVLIAEGLTQNTTTANVTIRTRPLVCVKPESIVDIYMVGEDFTVGVYIEQVVDLYSWEIGMEWDPTVLECLKFKEGPFLKTGGGTITISGNINNTEGRIYPPYGCTLTYPAEVGVNGSGTLAYVDFTVKNYGQTNINLTVTLYDSTYPYPAIILVDVQSGWFKLSPPVAHDIDAFKIQAPAIAFPKTLTMINATIRNIGLDNESNIAVQFMVNSSVLDSTTIIFLESMTSTIVSFPWAVPETPATYNLTVYAVPVPEENLTSNNYAFKLVTVKLIPMAHFTYSPTNPVVGELVTFDASLSYDPDGTIVSYKWDFGDGTTGTQMITTHAYFPEGTYIVTLNVTDNEGYFNTTTAAVTVTVTRASDTLEVEIDAGLTYHRGDLVEYYILVLHSGEPINVDLNAVLYYANGTLQTDLSASVEHIATGLYRVPYVVPLDAPLGTYALVVEANLLELNGASLKSFILIQ